VRSELDQKVWGSEQRQAKRSKTVGVVATGRAATQDENLASRRAREPSIM
jgi:hypothetical protein